MSSYSLCDFREDTGVGGLFGSTRLFLYLVHVRSVLRSTHRSRDFKAACYMKQIGLESPLCGACESQIGCTALSGTTSFVF